MGRIQSGWPLAVEPTAKCQSLPQLFFLPGQQQTITLSHPVGSLLRREMQPYHLRFVPLACHTLYFFSPLKTSLVSQHSSRLQHGTERKLLKGPQSLPPCSQNKLCEALVGGISGPRGDPHIRSPARVCDQGRGPVPSHKRGLMPALVLQESLAVTCQTRPRRPDERLECGCDA